MIPEQYPFVLLVKISWGRGTALRIEYSREMKIGLFWECSKGNEVENFG
jgi:hypothetical protein